MEAPDTGEFLQGFLEEAGELIQSVNQGLLRLEQVAAQLAGQLEDDELDSADRLASEVERDDLLKELFRSFHTLKGLAGMVGLSEAAKLSHAMETALQKMQRTLGTQSTAGEEAHLDPVLIDRLFSATRTLNEVIDTLRSPAHTSNQPMPDVQPDLRALENWLHPEFVYHQPADSVEPEGEAAAAAAEANIPGNGAAAQPEAAAEPEAAHHALAQRTEAQDARHLLPGLAPYPEILQGLGEAEQRKILVAAQAGHSFALIVFTSSAERAVQGENVDIVRQQIQEAGAIIKAVPVLSAGQMKFLFLAASPQPWDPGRLLADEVIPLPVQMVVPEPAKPGHSGRIGAGDRRAAIYAADPNQISARSVVRVDLERLDELMRYAGDLLLLRSRMGNDLERLGGPQSAARRDLQQTYQQFGRTLRDLRRAILRARMVPLAETFNHMPLVVRDLARSQQKEVRLVLQGEQTEVDKVLVERLLDPLIHLVRNAISHGIESPAERVAQGKPGRGTLTLRGFPEGDHIIIEVADDGHGVNLARVAERAFELGWRADHSPVDAEEALELITRPGFSTQSQADLDAGRGVGLDVVQRMVWAFGGRLSLETHPGKGTTFRLRLPLALVIVDTLLVRCGQERYAIPRDSIERIIEFEPTSVVVTEGGELLPRKEGYYVLYRLANLLGTPSIDAVPRRLFGLVGLMDQAENGAVRANALPQAGVPPRTGVPLQAGVPLLVADQVIDLREVVVHTLNDPLVAQPGIGGATQLGDGSVILILDVPSLLRMAKRRLNA